MENELKRVDGGDSKIRIESYDISNHGPIETDNCRSQDCFPALHSLVGIPLSVVVLNSEAREWVSDSKFKTKKATPSQKLLGMSSNGSSSKVHLPLLIELNEQSRHRTASSQKYKHNTAPLHGCGGPDRDGSGCRSSRHSDLSHCEDASPLACGGGRVLLNPKNKLLGHASPSIPPAEVAHDSATFVRQPSHRRFGPPSHRRARSEPIVGAACPA
jgi:hypothetical protein